MVILFDRFNLPDDVFDIVFSTPQQALAARLLIKTLKENKGEMGRDLMSLFANQLHDGKISIAVPSTPQYEELDLPNKKINISYNKRQFYDRVLTPMRSMGLIEFDLYKKVYRISHKFHNVLEDIGKLWVQEVKRK
jgi:hypothetical protein